MKNYYFDGAKKLNVNKIGNIMGGQDGAIFNSLLFRLDSSANGHVYDLKSKDLKEVGDFRLDNLGVIVPHDNCAFFSDKYYDEKDEFPIFYTNVYNAYPDRQDRQGMLIAYRIVREDKNYVGKILQAVRVGFTDDLLWRSKDVKDIRPYGNLLLSKKDNLLYAFVMRDQDKKTRFFAFEMPSIKDGKENKELGVKEVVLQKEQIVDTFDADYIHFMQGGIIDNGYLYSAEGFSVKEKRENLPAIRVFDLKNHRQVMHVNLFDELGLKVEPECIDFDGDKLVYSDYEGNVYQVTFE